MNLFTSFILLFFKKVVDKNTMVSFPFFLVNKIISLPTRIEPLFEIQKINKIRNILPYHFL